MVRPLVYRFARFILAPVVCVFAMATFGPTRGQSAIAAPTPNEAFQWKIWMMGNVRRGVGIFATKQCLHDVEGVPAD
jgi:hypothetical protein